MRLVAVLVPVLFLPFASQAAARNDDVTLTVKPRTVPFGGEVSVQWKVSSSYSEVYLLGVGKVVNSGSQNLRIEANSTVILIAQGSEGVQARSTKIDVTGARGENGFPQTKDAFRNPLRFDFPSREYAAVVSALYNALQDDLGFTLDPNAESDQFRCFSSYRKLPEAQRNLDRTMESRRVSFYVELNAPKQGSTSTFGVIRVLIESKKLIESRYVSDDPGELDQVLTLKLRDLILKRL